MITVWVPGAPKTKGSMVQQQQRRGGRLVQSVPGSERWAALVAEAAQQFTRGPNWTQTIPAGVPVAARLTFWMPQTDVAQGGAGSGDVDKLARNVLDALTKAGAYGDDVQVVNLVVNKYPAREYPGPGLLIQLAPAEQHQDEWLLLTLSQALQRQSRG
jgi:crossover junction endodeoxyribonuclease RusA